MDDATRIERALNGEFLGDMAPILAREVRRLREAAAVDAGRMTADRFQRIVARLSTSGYCRSWLHLNQPTEEPWLMAVEVLEVGMLTPVRIPELERYGFRPHREGSRIYVVERGDELGRPFRPLASGGGGP